jgi:acylphosphatase
MNKCLRITAFGDCTVEILDSFVHKLAQKYELEGTASIVDNTHTVITVCGEKAMVDSFIDALHKGTGQWAPDDIEIEPFLKDKDYRGVFRVIK